MAGQRDLSEPDYPIWTARTRPNIDHAHWPIRDYSDVVAV